MKELSLSKMESIEGGGGYGEACLGGALVGFFVGGGVFGALAGCAIGMIGEAL